MTNEELLELLPHKRDIELAVRQTYEKLSELNAQLKVWETELGYLDMVSEIYNGVPIYIRDSLESADYSTVAGGWDDYRYAHVYMNAQNNSTYGVIVKSRIPDFNKCLGYNFTKEEAIRLAKQFVAFGHVGGTPQ